MIFSSFRDTSRHVAVMYLFLLKMGDKRSGCQDPKSIGKESKKDPRLHFKSVKFAAAAKRKMIW